MALLFGAVPVQPFDLKDPPLLPQEREILDEYRLHCRPGRFIEDVKANLNLMRQKHPGSAFLKDTAFLAAVHYLDRGSVWDGNDRRPSEWMSTEIFDTIFNGYTPSREAWKRSHRLDNTSTGFAALGGLLMVTHAYFGLYTLSNEPPRGEASLKAYRFAHLALPFGWISSFVYSGICAKRGNRELDNAFFETNGKAIAKRLAEGD